MGYKINDPGLNSVGTGMFHFKKRGNNNNQRTKEEINKKVLTTNNITIYK